MNNKYFNYILKKAKREKLPIKGLTFHVGSQNSSILSWKKAFKNMELLIKNSKKQSIEILYLNIGGGIPAQYTNKIPSLQKFLIEIAKLCVKFQKKYPNIQIFAEPGRAMCANTMALITSVIDLKNYKKPSIAVLDTGVFNGIIEPIENFEYPVFLLNKKTLNEKNYSLVGFSCEGFDIIRKKVKLSNKLQIGDKLIITHAGAYTFVYKKFHMVEYPPIIKL